MTEKLTVTATVRIEIEIDVSSHWGGDCTMAQVHSQAIRDAEGVIDKLLVADGRGRMARKPQILGVNTRTETIKK